MEKIKYYSLIVLIAILFTSLVFYTANTFFPNNNINCYKQISAPKDLNNNQTPAQLQKYDKKIKDCEIEIQKKESNLDSKKLILILILNILITFVLFLYYHKNINLGLLFGLLLSTIIASISYHNSTSIIGLILLILLTISLLFYIVKKEN